MRGSPALLVAGAAVGLTLYNRHIWQDAWGSLFGPDVALLLGNPAANLGNDNGVVSGPGSIGAWDDWTLSGCNKGNYSCLNAWKAGQNTGTGGTAGADALLNAEKNVTAQLSPSGTTDWINWCLNWVRRVKTQITGSDPGGVYSLPTASSACASSILHPGAAPLGASVCFKDTPGSGLTAGHIGISNGNGTYNSVGISHGGYQTLPYISNPNYIGWF